MLLCSQQAVMERWDYDCLHTYLVRFLLWTRPYFLFVADLLVCTGNLARKVVTVTMTMKLRLS